MTSRPLSLLLLGALAFPVSAQTTFTNLSSQLPSTPSGLYWGVSWVDVDQDDDLDLFWTALTTTGNLLLRNESGTFVRDTGSQIAQGNGGVGHCWGDIDRDGDLDLVTVGRGPNPFGDLDTGGESYIYRNEGDGTYVRLEGGPVGPSAGNRGWGCSMADYDEDGHLDLAIVHPRGFVGAPNQTNHLFRGSADGTFTRVTTTPITVGLAPYTVGSWSDYDQDGDMDFHVGSGPAGTDGPDFFYRNQLSETGTATFTRIVGTAFADEPRDGQVVNWQDMDNDGDFDLFITNYGAFPAGRVNDLYRNDEGTFVKITDSPLSSDIFGVSLGNSWGDVDNDGDLDVVVTSGGGGTSALYLNDGEMGFTLDPGGTAEINGFTSGGSFADYDDDGDLDLAMNTTTVAVLRNDLNNGNGWIKLDLVGVASNTTALGAKVRVTATINGTSVTQLREVSNQNTFNSMNDLTVHVGLADATVVGEVRIEWPLGAVETYTDLEINDHYIATEGDGLVPVSNELETPEEAGLWVAPPAPNPTGDRAEVRYMLPKAGPVRLSIHDARGREVVVLVEGRQPAGHGEARFDGAGLASGVYLVRLQASGKAVSRSFMLTR
ncbi:MAG: FG-GAP-like repeat-containing protein [Bacteroidota bacterium]